VVESGGKERARLIGKGPVGEDNQGPKRSRGTKRKSHCRKVRKSGITRRKVTEISKRKNKHRR